MIEKVGKSITTFPKSQGVEWTRGPIKMTQHSTLITLAREMKSGFQDPILS